MRAQWVVVAVAILGGGGRGWAQQMPNPPNPPTPNNPANPADPWGGANPTPANTTPPGKPFSIEMVVDDGANHVTDQWHPRYKPGSVLHWHAVVRDANGQIIPEPSGCTPVPDLEDQITADRQERAGFGGPGRLIGANGIEFGPAKGVFTVNLHCNEDPSITTKSHQAPINWETSTDRFAACTDHGCDPVEPPQPQGPLVGRGGHLEPPPPPPGKTAAASHGPDVGKILLGTALILGGILAVVELANLAKGGGGGAGSCYCVVITSSTNGSCPPGNYPYATQSDCESGPMGLAYLENFCQCKVATCSATFASQQCGPCPCPSMRDAPPRNVHELVSRGFASTRSRAVAPPPRSPAPSTNAHADHAAAWIGAGAAVVSLAATSYALWLNASGRPTHVEVIPWATPEGGGVAISGRF